MKVCSECKAINSDEARFCCECGKPLPESQAGGKLPQKTILATPAIKIDERAVASPVQSTPQPSSPPQASAKKTIIGMPSVEASAISAKKPPASEPAPAVAAKAVKAKAPDEMIDIGKAKKAAQEAAGKTILGVSPISVDQISGGGTPAKSYKEEKPVFEPTIEAPVIAQQKTPSYAEGMAGIGGIQPQRQRSEASAEGMYVKGQIQMAPSARASLPGESTAPRPSRIGATTMLMVRKAAAIPRWLIIAIVLVVAAGTGLGFLIKKFVIEPRKPKVVKMLVKQNPNFQSVDIEIETINTKNVDTIMVGEQKFKIENQKSLLTLPIGPVHLGENIIEAKLFDKEGKEKGTLTLDFLLTKFWQPQTQTLEEANPVVGIYFQTMPDASLFIDGEPSPGEGPGKFLYRKKISELLSKSPPSEGNTWVVSFDYLLKRKGAKDDTGKVEIEIPTVRLEIEKPANGAIVTKDSVECTGKTELDAQVKINGTMVDVQNGRFATKIPLPEYRIYEIVVEAISAKRGPRIAKVKIERVKDMTELIKDYEKGVDKELGWEKLNQNPKQYTGKRVSMNGKIFNIQTEKGVTAFQMLVADGCPEGARCSVVVTYKGEMEAGEQSFVTVLGEVTGSETLETKTGSKFTAPKIEAKFVLAQEEQKKKKKKGR